MTNIKKIAICFAGFAMTTGAIGIWQAYEFEKLKRAYGVSASQPAGGVTILNPLLDEKFSEAPMQLSSQVTVIYRMIDGRKHAGVAYRWLKSKMIGGDNDHRDLPADLHAAMALQALSEADPGRWILVKERELFDGYVAVFRIANKTEEGELQKLTDETSEHAVYMK